MGYELESVCGGYVAPGKWVNGARKVYIPSKWQTLKVSILVAALAFTITLFGLCGIIRLFDRLGSGLLYPRMMSLKSLVSMVKEEDVQNRITKQRKKKVIDSDRDEEGEDVQNRIMKQRIEKVIDSDWDEDMKKQVIQTLLDKSE